MADALEFDFEDNLEQTDLKTQTLAPTLAPSNQLEPRAQKNYRQTVCRHWLRNLCMKGDKCGFLHQFDKERMPVCRYFAKYGECKEPDCPYKHSNDDVKECNMYKLGFCIHGPNCRYKHIRLDGPPPPPNEACLIGRPGHIHGVLPFAQRQRQKQIREEKERQLLIASGVQPKEETVQAIAAPLPPGPPPIKAKTVDVNLALPEAKVGAEPEQDFDFEA